jgi:phenylpropionate dioxygenase-like ring-hydroxylating dioxygenase large terminal subunit
MYINFWYPMIRSEDLAPGKPEKVKVLGFNFAVFRNAAGEAVTVSDTCIHRGGSLAGPWELGQQPRVVKDCIVCPYHGWEFDATGHCVAIPSLGYQTKPPSRARIDAYPTVEKYGIVFAFLGDLPEVERPPMIDIPEWDKPGWRANTVITLDLNYYYERSIENGLDPAHNEFVHPTHGFKGINRDTYKVRDYEVRNYDQNWGMWFLHKFDSPGLKDKTWTEAETKAGGLYAGSGTHGPSMMITEINVGEGQTFKQYFLEQPIDDEHTRVFFVNMRNFMLDPKHDGPIHARNKVIAQQDIDILENVYPKRTPISNAKEMLMPADRAVAAYREWLAKFDDRGWRTDWETFQRRTKNTAFAIPSPRRREGGSWVVEAVPLVDSREARKLRQAS